MGWYMVGAKIVGKPPQTRTKSRLTRLQNIELAPPPLTSSSDGPLSSTHQKPPHDSRVNLPTLRKFEQEAFYRHGHDAPQFDRRMQVWIQTSSDGKPVLETIESPEPQPPVPALAHSLDRVLFKSVISRVPG
jgi:hypothetical protein